MGDARDGGGRNGKAMKKEFQHEYGISENGHLGENGACNIHAFAHKSNSFYNNIFSSRIHACLTILNYPINKNQVRK